MNIYVCTDVYKHILHIYIHTYNAHIDIYGERE